jgi:hypothetical protein
MKKTFQSSMILFSLLLAGCSQINYDHPLDSQVSYDNSNYFEDSDGDGIANLWDEDDSLFIKNQDREPPVLKLVGPDTVKLPFKDPFHVLDKLKKDYTVSDNKDLNPTVVVSADFSVEFPATNTMRYTATDKANLSTTIYRTVIVLPDSVKDTTKPEIIFPQVDVEIYQGETFDPMKQINVYDRTDGDLKNRVTISGKVDTAVPDVYTLTYTVIDNSDNRGTLVRKITVLPRKTIDNDFPVITVIGSMDTTIGPTDKWTDPGYTATDTTEGNLTSSVIVTGEVKNDPGNYTLTYTVQDKALHITTETRIVKRSTGTYIGSPPAIVLKYQKDTVVTVIKGGTFKMPDVNIEDPDEKIPTDSIHVYPNPINTSTVGIFPITLLVTDKNGNEGKLVIKMKVVEGSTDNTRPVITLKGKNPDTVGVSATITYKDSGATAMDNVDKDISAKIVKTGTVDRTKEGKNTLTYIVKDLAGNADTATRTVVVKQDVKPDLLVTYKVPASAALATLNKSYTSAEIVGTATSAPNLSNMTEFKINWDKTQSQIYDISINISGSVGFIPLKDATTHTLGQTGPTIKFTGVTKIAKFDGEYYVTVDGTNFVMVKKDGSFAIVMKP